MDKPHYLGARADRTSGKKLKCQETKCRYLATHSAFQIGSDEDKPTWLCAKHTRLLVSGSGIHQICIFPEYHFFLKQLSDWSLQQQIRMEQKAMF